MVRSGTDRVGRHHSTRVVSVRALDYSFGVIRKFVGRCFETMSLIKLVPVSLASPDDFLTHQPPCCLAGTACEEERSLLLHLLVICSRTADGL